MKNKIVLWGTNEKDERILLALELRTSDNKVLIHSFPEEAATDDFYSQMMDKWRVNATEEVAFPEGHQVIERELSVTESLLPDEIRIERGDLIKRAQTEWHFMVLSSKLSQAYRSELAELEERISALSRFDGDVWETLKGFWGKVQNQLRDRTLLREHGDELRARTNKAFEDLKTLRSKLDEEFRAASKDNLEKVNGVLQDIEARITENRHLSKIFEELKGVQRDIRNIDFTREHRNKIWERVDKAFKDVKEKRFGDRGGDGSPGDRLNKRYAGLMNAIGKMERSISRDESDLEFQNRQIDRTDGQLEAQIRQAKTQMIKQRIDSKKEKLTEMLQTKVQLEGKQAKEKEREAKREEQKKREEAKKAARAKIAEEVQANKAALEEKATELESAANAIKGDKKVDSEAKPEEPVAAAEAPKEEATKEETPKEEESLLDAISTTIGESIEDVVDTVKAVAEVVGDKIEEKAAEVESAVKAMKDNAEADSKTEPDEAAAGKETKEDDSLLDAIGATIGESLGDMADTVKAVAGVVGEKIEEKVNEIKEDMKSDEEE